MDQLQVLIVLRYFYCPSQPIGGAERQALRLAKKLQKKGVSVTVVTGLWDWGQPRHEMIEGVTVHRHFTGWGMFDIRGIRRLSQYLYLFTLFLYLLWHRKRYDVIHSQSARIGASVVIRTGKLLQKKTLVRSMSSGAWGDVAAVREDRSLWGTRWMLDQLKDADCAIALNQQVVHELTELGVAPEKIIHIPNGVDVDVIKPKANYKLRNSTVHVVFVGRLHPKKGVDTLLSAWQRVQTQAPELDWRLTLVGGGDLREDMEAIAQQLSIAETLTFLGQVADPFPYLLQSDIFVLPSKSEGMSNAVLEAMAHGLPCIITDIPGNRDVITHGHNGVLAPVDDAAALADAIRQLGQDRDLRARLGRAARSVVEENYSVDHVAERYKQLYIALLHNQDL